MMGFNYGSNTATNTSTGLLNSLLDDGSKHGSRKFKDTPYKDTRTPEEKKRDSAIAFMLTQIPSFNQNVGMAMQNNPMSLQALGARPREEAGYFRTPLPDQNSGSGIISQILQALRGPKKDVGVASPFRNGGE